MQAPEVKMKEKPGRAEREKKQSVGYDAREHYLSKLMFIFFTSRRLMLELIHMNI